MPNSDIARQALRGMSDDELKGALSKVSGPILRELASRGYDVTLVAPAIAVSALPCVQSLYKFTELAGA